MSVFKLIQSDLYRFGGEVNVLSIIKALLGNNRSFNYNFWLKLCRTGSTALSFITRYMHRHISINYQIQIPIPKEIVIGRGLYFGHATTMVVSSTADIGKNCNLSNFVSMGSNYGKAASIGDNVYIGPSFSIVEGVEIGDNVTVGTGSVVVKNIESNAVAVGKPAKVINIVSDSRFIKNRFELLSV